MPKKIPRGKKAIPKKTKTEKPFAFVIMPFVKAEPIKGGYDPLDEEELRTISNMITKTLKTCGFEASRLVSQNDILGEIVVNLDKAELVIADVTSLNPNVMYELGIRHGFCKKTIVMTQDRSELPFDLAGYDCIKYGWKTDAEKAVFRKELRTKLKVMEKNVNPRYGPVHTHLDSKVLGIHDEEHEKSIKKLEALGAEIGFLWRTIREVYGKLESQFPNAFQRSEKKGFKIVEKNLPKILPEEIWPASGAGWPFTLPAIDLFLSTRYIGDEYDAFGDISKFTTLLGSFRMSMNLDTGVKGFLLDFHLLDIFTDDVPTLLEALRNQKKGIDLDLRSKILDLASKIEVPKIRGKNWSAKMLET